MYFCRFIAILIIDWNNHVVNGKQINAVCSWGDPSTSHIDPFACYIRIPFELHENDTLNFSSEIDTTEILEVNFWLPHNSRHQWAITSIPNVIFIKFSNLKRFSLPGRIQLISHSDFLHATNLKRLSIGNQIKAIPENVFLSLNKLELLDLSWNRISVIHENGFNGLTALRVLKLNRNQLKKLRAHTFDGTPFLEELILNNNQIDHIRDSTFKLPNLKRLDLSHNKLNNLSDDIFKVCNRLEFLDLKSNRLTAIKHSIYHLVELQYLNLDNNQITDIRLRALAELPFLELLSMENNGYALNDSIFISDSTSSSGMKSIIKNLYLSGNALKDREILLQLWSLGLNQLEKLHIDNNAFEFINFYPIAAFPKLKEIDLGQNHWKCEWLEQTLEKLETDGIEVNLFSSRFPSSPSFQHVNFIQCT